MKTVLKPIIAACLLAMAMPAQSQSLFDTLIDNTLNFYEDQNRESIFDVDGDGVASDGDVFIGYVRIDDRTIPSGDPLLESDSLYAMFSTTLVVDGGGAIQPDANGDYQLNFTSTANDGLGLSLEEITGDANTVGQMGALFSSVDQNLISSSPGDFDNDGRLTIFDFLYEIANDDLDMVFGLEDDNADGTDHWISNQNTGLVDPLQDFTLLEGASIVGGLPGGTEVVFHASLGVTWVAMGEDECPDVITESVWCFGQLVEDDVENPLDPSLHEAVIQNGTISGANDLIFSGENPYFSGEGGLASGVGQWNGLDFYGLSSNADFGLFPVHVQVPEPTTLALMGVGLLGIGAARRRRKA